MALGVIWLRSHHILVVVVEWLPMGQNSVFDLKIVTLSSKLDSLFESLSRRDCRG